MDFDFDFLSLPWAVLLIRAITFIAAGSAFFWALESAIIRHRLKLADFADWVLVVVGLYWSVYTGWIIIVYDGAARPPITSYIFNMQFGLLLTLAALASLVKDRMLVSDLFKRLHKKETDSDKGDDIT